MVGRRRDGGVAAGTSGDSILFLGGPPAHLPFPPNYQLTVYSVARECC